MGQNVSITEETATVYRAGKRRYLTLKAARRGAANHYIRQLFRATGDDPSEVPADQWSGWVTKLADQLKRGEEMLFDSDWYDDDYGDPRTPAYGVGA